MLISSEFHSVTWSYLQSLYSFTTPGTDVWSTNGREQHSNTLNNYDMVLRIFTVNGLLRIYGEKTVVRPVDRGVTTDRDTTLPFLYYRVD